MNTRLQVEHPVTEETAGIDLVRAQFRIAEGEALDPADPAPRGHSIEFRINGEDPGRNFLPAPGTVTAFVPPAGPGVRVDAGVSSGSVVGGAFDSLLAKVIITGANRQEALERARRALDEMVVDGMATALPFHRAVVRDPAFAPADADEPFRVHNRWIETEFDNTIPAFSGGAGTETADAGRETVVVEVGGKRLEVVLPASLAAGPAPGGAGGASGRRGPAPKRKGGAKALGAVTGATLASPMQGTIVKVAVSDGDAVAAGDLIVVLEAMKMEQPITAHRAGTVTALSATVGAVVASGATLCEIKD